jgi:hypothetical protein
MSKRKRYSPEYKRELDEVVRAKRPPRLPVRSRSAR